MLKIIHEVFYKLKNDNIKIDVWDIYEDYKQNLFKNIRFSFSGFVDKGKPIEDNNYYK